MSAGRVCALQTKLRAVTLKPFKHILRGFHGVWFRLHTGLAAARGYGVGDGRGVLTGVVTGFGVGGGIGVSSFNNSETVTNLNPFASSSLKVCGMAWMVCA